MILKYIIGTAFSLFLVSATGTAHEVPLNFRPLNGQSEEQKLSDLHVCKKRVVEEENIAEPHPLMEKDPLEREPEPPRPGVGVSAGGIGVGIGGAGKPENEQEWALKEAEHLQRHRAFETAMRACMEEKGYK